MLDAGFRNFTCLNRGGLQHRGCREAAKPRIEKDFFFNLKMNSRNARMEKFQTLDLQTVPCGTAGFFALAEGTGRGGRHATDLAAWSP